MCFLVICPTFLSFFVTSVGDPTTLDINELVNK